MEGGPMKEQPELRVVTVPTDSLVPYANNANIHSDHQVDQIVASIEEFGFNDPIAVWENEDGVTEIVAGHGRVLAARKLGMDELPVIYLNALTDEQRRAYTHVHNQLTRNSVFDVDILDMEMESLNFDWESLGFDVGLDFDDENTHSGTELSESISVVIDCADSVEAEEVFNRLTEGGYKCRISTL